MAQTRRRIYGGKGAVQSASRTEVNLEVVSADEQGYLLAWTLGETKIDSPRQAQNIVASHMANLLRGYQIQLEIDKSGVITGVKNWRELQQTSSKIVDALTAELKNAEVNPIEIAKVRGQALAMFASKQQIEQLVTHEARIMFAPLGKAYAVGVPVTYQTKLPNTFGGDPFPARGEFLLSAYEPGAGRAIILWKQVVTPEDAAPILDKTIVSLAQQAGQPPPPPLPTSFMLEDRGEFVIRTPSVWIDQFLYTRTITTEEGVQENGLSMKRVVPKE
jgi:hypothetical protein